MGPTNDEMDEEDAPEPRPISKFLIVDSMYLLRRNATSSAT